ncbi:hypothetical protein BDZ97DRAFT_973921 [Flammula alnicola]|nr:hypothetical protein BDZ97DRAFT_973921 [Flammula alnicola]
MPEFTIHPLLLNSQSDIIPGHNCRLFWDLRELPDYARCVTNPEEFLSVSDLAESATQPALNSIDITCLTFPWRIHIDCSEGITVGDVLHAVQASALRLISHDEWYVLSETEKIEANRNFINRCKLATDFHKCRMGGVRRMDCLQHTLFSGLFASLETDGVFIMELRSPK